MRALRVHVYSNRKFKGCSNNGISEKYDNILLLCDDGNIEVNMDNPPENLCKTVVRRIGVKEYQHIEPVAVIDKGCVGWMSGGSYAGSCDERFRRISDYPLSIHDRQETTEQYERMSR